MTTPIDPGADPLVKLLRPFAARAQKLLDDNWTCGDPVLLGEIAALARSLRHQVAEREQLVAYRAAHPKAEAA